MRYYHSAKRNNGQKVCASIKTRHATTVYNAHLLLPGFLQLLQRGAADETRVYGEIRGLNRCGSIRGIRRGFGSQADSCC